MRVLAIIQARMGSSRLPGKVLATVAGRPLLWYVVRRTQLAKRVDQVVVAVPETSEDLEIAGVCAEWNIPCVMGPERGMAMIENLDGVAALYVYETEKGEEMEIASKRFAQFVERH